MRKSVLTKAALICIALWASSGAWAANGVIGSGINAAGAVFGNGIGKGSALLATHSAANGAADILSQDRARLDERLYASGYDAPGEHYGIFSDPAPGTYDSYRPNYVAPVAPPPPTYIDPNGQTYCRPYSRRTRMSGRLQENYGTACLQPDGSWRGTQ